MIIFSHFRGYEDGLNIKNTPLVGGHSVCEAIF